SEDTRSRFRCQRVRDELFLPEVTLPLIQEKEEGLVLLDGPSDSSAELISIGVRLCGLDEIVKELHRVQGRVVVRVEEGTMILIASGAGLQSDLSGSASHFGIDGVRRYLNFFHEIRRRVCCGECAVPIHIPSIRHDESISRRVDLAAARSGKR